MDLKVYFVRHGMTITNEEGRFGGTTDTLLTRQGWADLYRLKETYEYPAVEKVFSSPAVRCRETASVLYPEHVPVILEGLWEYKFGKMENHLVSDFLDQPVWRKWLDQDPDCSFADDGETLLEASFRVRAAMTRIVKDALDNELGRIAVIAHGEILALLMDATLQSNESADAFKLCPNGMGVVASLNKQGWFKKQTMRFEGFLPEGAPRLRPEDSPFFADRT